jgi:hypothetical protein
MCVVYNASVHHQLDEILRNQTKMLQNQHNIAERLRNIELRLVQFENKTLFDEVQSHKNECKIHSSANNEDSFESIDNSSNSDSKLGMAFAQSDESYHEPFRDDNSPKDYLSENEIHKIYVAAKSRGNFAAQLAQTLYSQEECITSNVMGTRGKRPLSPCRMSFVRRTTFRLFPCSDRFENLKIWKKECIKAIDSKNRKIKLFPTTSRSKLKIKNLTNDIQSYTAQNTHHLFPTYLI